MGEEKRLHERIDTEFAFRRHVSWVLLGQEAELVQLNHRVSDWVRAGWSQFVPGTGLCERQIEYELEDFDDFWDSTLLRLHLACPLDVLKQNIVDLGWLVL